MFPKRPDRQARRTAPAPFVPTPFVALRPSGGTAAATVGLATFSTPTARAKARRTAGQAG